MFKMFICWKVLITDNFYPLINFQNLLGKSTLSRLLIKHDHGIIIFILLFINVFRGQQPCFR